MTSVVGDDSDDGAESEGRGSGNSDTLTWVASATLTNADPAVFEGVRAVVKGGQHDSEDLYCASIEWVWGDDTKSESKADCEPYEAGKSEIKRRYTLDHVYQTGGQYKVEFYLKQKNKRVLGAQTTITIRPGARDIGQ